MITKGRFPTRRTSAGAVLISVASASFYFGGDPQIAAPMLIAGSVLVVVSVGWWAVRGRRGIAAMMSQAERRAERHKGFVSYWDRRRLSSKHAMRRNWARKLRPDLFRIDGPRFDARLVDALLGVPVRAVKTWIRLHRVDVREYAVNLGRDAYGGFWVPLNSVVVRVAAARSGKSVAMADRIIEHRGPAVVTSIRKDLLILTAQLRARNGHLFVFNPGNVATIPSNLKWSVLSGCSDMTTAERRAAQLLGEANNEERQSWITQANRVLVPMLYAAARAQLPMRVVARWIAAGGDEALKSQKQITDILRRSPEGPAQIENLAQFFSMVGAGDRTRLSITNTLAPALRWLGNPRIAALGDAQGDDLFDIERDLIGTANTVYALGAEGGVTSPLTGALVAEIAYQAARIAENMPGGKLTPPLLLALDELALTVPGPVPQWTKYMGGCGVPMDLGVQQRAALDDVWGADGRRSILGNASAVLVGAGCNDPIELRDWELLGDTRWVPQRNAKGDVMPDAGRIQVPVVSAGKIAGLPIGQVIAFNRGPVTKLDTRNAEDRKDVRRAGQYVPPVETSYEKDAQAPAPRRAAPTPDDELDAAQSAGGDR